jgi:hypothetical protein
LTRPVRTALATAATLAALLVPAASAGAGPAANKSGEELVTYLTTGKIKVKNPISFQILCGAPAPANCLVQVEAEIKVPGPNPQFSDVGTLLPGQVGIFEISVSKGARTFIKDNLKKSKLTATVTATNSVSGEVDVDGETFKFKK